MNIVDLDKLCEMFWDGNYMEIHKDDIPSIPSAFEGMTHREIISEFAERDDSFAIMVDEVNGTVNIELSLEFWDSPYKGVSE